MQERANAGPQSNNRPRTGIIIHRARSPGRATSTRLMHKEENLERFRRHQRLSTGLSIAGHEDSGEVVRGRGQHASDSGYGTDSPGYSGHFPGHYRDPRQVIAQEDPLTSDSESEDLHDALSVSSARDSEDDDVFVTDMMTVCFENSRITPNKDIENKAWSRVNEMDELDEVDGDPPPKDNPEAKETSGRTPGAEGRGAVGGARPRALPLTVSTAVDIPPSSRHQSPNVSFTPPRFYSGNTSFPFPPSPSPFGSPSESVFTFGRRAPPPSNLQRSLHIEHPLNRQRSFSDESNNVTERPSDQLNVALRERVFSETDMRRARTQSESAATSSRNQALPSGFRDRCYSESAIQMRLQRSVGRELRRISDEFHVSYTSPSSSPVQNGMVRSEGLHTSRSFPGSSRGATWWQSIIQQFSPFFGQRLETIESPVDAIDDPFFDNDSSDDGASRSAEEPSTSTRRHSRVTFDLGVGEMDDLDDEDDLDGVQ